MESKEIVRIVERKRTFLFNIKLLQRDKKKQTHNFLADLGYTNQALTKLTDQLNPGDSTNTRPSPKFLVAEQLLVASTS